MKIRKKTGGIWIFLVLGFAYFVWLKLTDIAIPCMFRKITGWLCPGCGITTLILCLTRLDFGGAWEANPFLFVTGPLLLTELLYLYRLEKKRKKVPAWNHGLVTLYAAALCIFGVLRNL